MKFYSVNNQSGITLVEILIVSAIVSTFFLAVFGALQYSQRLLANSQARLSAMSLASDRIEYFRSLPYNDVGTVGGPVFGSIPNNNVLTLNGITFYEDVRVEYVLDPGDDVMGVDSNGIITDYKKVEIELEWFAHDATSSISYTSNIVPLTIETAAGFGAIKVEVRDEATGLPLPGADVFVTNDTIFPPIDFARTTGPDGSVLIAVPQGSGYHASTTIPGYSFDTTYRVTGVNPSPSPNSFSVNEALISDRPFRIGELSDISLTVFSDMTEVAVTEDFDDINGLRASTSVEINSTDETLELDGSPGSYDASGTAQLNRIVPGSNQRWEKAVIIGTMPIGTQFTTQFYTGDCSISCSLVSDSDLPGNSIGISGQFIDLTELDPVGYPDLTVQINLFGDTTVTPSIEDVAVYYRANETALSGYTVDFTGDKLIGTPPDVFKTEISQATAGDGEVALTDVEFDDYTIDTGSRTPTVVCGDVVFDNAVEDVYFTHEAGVDSTLEVVLENTLTHTLRVIVTTGSGEPLPGAEVDLQRTGFSNTATTGVCGQAFINNTDGNETDYEVVVSRPGFDDETISGVTVDGDTRLQVILNQP